MEGYEQLPFQPGDLHPPNPEQGGMSGWLPLPQEFENTDEDTGRSISQNSFPTKSSEPVETTESWNDLVSSIDVRATTF